MMRTLLPVRAGYIVTSVVLAILAVGYVWQMSWATATWPWPDGRLSYTFVASILAAIAIAALWIGWSGELGASVAGALNVLVIAAGMTIYLGWLMFDDAYPNLLPFVVVTALVIPASAGLAWWSRSIEVHDQRTTPRPVLIGFCVFFVALVAAGIALILRVPSIFPWPLKPESSVMFGLIFIGDAVYFLYGLLKPRWPNAKGQLLSFLAYDLVLLPVFLPHIATVQPAHRLSLGVYLIVLLGSCLLAGFYLLIHPVTRFGSSSG